MKASKLILSRALRDCVFTRRVGDATSRLFCFQSTFEVVEHKVPKYRDSTGPMLFNLGYSVLPNLNILHIYPNQHSWIISKFLLISCKEYSRQFWELQEVSAQLNITRSCSIYVSAWMVLICFGNQAFQLHILHTITPFMSCTKYSSCNWYHWSHTFLQFRYLERLLCGIPFAYETPLLMFHQLRCQVAMKSLSVVYRLYSWDLVIQTSHWRHSDGIMVSVLAFALHGIVKYSYLSPSLSNFIWSSLPCYFVSYSSGC